jgi:hypothetical protein
MPGALRAPIAVQTGCPADLSRRTANPTYTLTIHPHPPLAEAFAFASEMLAGTVTDIYYKKP